MPDVYRKVVYDPNDSDWPWKLMAILGDDVTWKSTEFTEDGTWNKPAGVQIALVLLVGGGSGGTGGEGGNGGEVRFEWIALPDAAADIPISIGAGGAGAIATYVTGSAENKSMAIASSSYSGTADDNFFDGDKTSDAQLSAWINYYTLNPINVNGQCWIGVDFGQAETFNTIFFYRRVYSTNRMPKTVKILGSDTGAFSGEETDYGTYSIEDVAVHELTLSQEFSNHIIRVEIHEAWGSSTTADLQEIEFAYLEDVESGGASSTGSYLSARGGEPSKGGGPQVAGVDEDFVPLGHSGGTGYRSASSPAMGCPGFGSPGVGVGAGGGSYGDGADGGAGDDEDGADATGYGGGGAAAGTAVSDNPDGGSGAPGYCRIIWPE